MFLQILVVRCHDYITALAGGKSEENLGAHTNHVRELGHITQVKMPSCWAGGCQNPSRSSLKLTSYRTPVATAYQINKDYYDLMHWKVRDVYKPRQLTHKMSKKEIYSYAYFPY